ncbi:CRISPR-associated protein Cas4 [Caldisphaera sp.]|uniref:CRISPR-associated protein Cas4 n=1 Tax=Caldisphaera sp. TaxID=2060322 RepID=UPI003D0EE8A7
MDYLIDVTTIKNFSYCQMIPYINLKYNFYEPLTESMGQGKKLKPFEAANNLKLPKPWKQEVKIIDKELGVSGKVDLIAGENSFQILEVKAFKRKIEMSYHFRDQLLVYSYLVNKNIGKVVKAHLYMGGETFSFDINSYSLSYAKSLIIKLKELVNKDDPPKIKPVLAKCKSCWYRHVCPANP